LASTVRSDDAERLAFAERKIDLLRDDDGAEPLGNFFEGEDGGHACLADSHCRPRKSGNPVITIRRLAPWRDRATSRARGYWGLADGGTTAEQLRRYVNNCSDPPVGISGAVLLVVITRSNLSPLRCHWPATSGVLVTFFTG